LLPKNTSFGNDLNFRREGSGRGAATSHIVKIHFTVLCARFAALLVGLCVVSSLGEEESGKGAAGNCEGFFCCHMV